MHHLIVREAAKRRMVRERCAFTLVELLIVIAIIALLSSAVMFAMYGSLEEAKATRTMSLIARVDQLLGDRWDSYRSRAVPIMITPGTAPKSDPFTDSNGNGVRDTGEPFTDLNGNGAYDYGAATYRLYALRELMRMEMPDRITDVQYDHVQLNNVPSLTLAYRRRVVARAGSFANWQAKPAHQGAECLYLIVESIIQETGEGSPFLPSDIGDVDNDGMPEILDGWGHPIEFLRWAPAFASNRQSQNGLIDPDPFDPMKADSRWTSATASSPFVPFLLFPLIFSAGPDGYYDIGVDDDLGPPIVFSQTTPPNDPYFRNAAGFVLGRQADANADGMLSYGDNIHSHLIEVK